MLEFLRTNFGLPHGGLYSNLIASGLLGAAGFIYGRAFERRAINRHEELKDHMRKIHRKLGIR